MFTGFRKFILFCLLLLPAAVSTHEARIRVLPNPYYPQIPPGELRLNYYYDRTGRWVKFSDWIPFRQRKYEPRFLEDFYDLYSLPQSYNVPEVKESIYFLVQAMTHRFRHPSRALCRIDTEEQHLKYRNLMFMHMNLLIMRMYLRLGSLFDKRLLRYHDLDVADDLEISFMIARTYYRESLTYWNQAKEYAMRANESRFELDIPAIENERFLIREGKLNYARIIELHLGRAEEKLARTAAFLDQQGRPRPVRLQMQQDIEKMYDQNFTPEPLDAPALQRDRNERDFFDPIFPPEPGRPPESGSLPESGR